MLMFRMANERQVRMKNERERAGHRTTFSVSFQAKRGTSQNTPGVQMITRVAPSGARALFFRVYGIKTLRLRGPSSSVRLGMTVHSVRQKSWKRSNPFLMTSFLVA